MGSFCSLCSKAALAALPNAFFRDDDAANFSQESHGGGAAAAAQQTANAPAANSGLIQLLHTINRQNSAS